MGVNAAGLGSKLLSFRNILEKLCPSVVFVEETKFIGDKTVDLEGFAVYTKNRAKCEKGGGILLAVKKELQPALVRDGGEQVEALSVCITTNQMNIRCVIAYGCQESAKVKQKDDFWSYLDIFTFIDL